MSPDRVMLTRAEAIRQRREEEQKRRDALTRKRGSRSKPAPAPKPERAPRKSASLTGAAANRQHRRYNVAMSSPYGRADAGWRAGQRPQASAASWLALGPRWFSLLLCVACGMVLYIFLTMDPFIVRGAAVNGNSRVSAREIASVLGSMGQSSAFLNPAQMEYNILAAFPEVSAAHVEVALPSEVTVTVTERQPLIAWQQDAQVSWVDGQGYAFPPRGDFPGLVSVQATGVPPAPATANLAQQIGARPFLTEEMITALATLARNLPKDAALIYSQQYGLGWSDPRGWKVFFGSSNAEMDTKLRVYQALVEHLNGEGIQPTMISVEYPDAPFYRVEQ